MKKYHKIQSIFKRDPNNNYKTFLEEYSEPYFQILCNNQWHFTEKIDGTNIRVIWDGKGVTFKGRTDLAEIPKYLLQELKKLFCHPDKINVFRETFSDKKICLYGEGFGYKIQKAGKQYISDSHDFILFDIKIGGWWLSPDDVERIGSALDILVVPYLGRGTLNDAIKMVKKGFKSKIGDLQAEGLVLRPVGGLLDRSGKRIITKVKSKDFG